MRKIILGILISFGTFFLMSHNASAFSINTPVTLKDTIKQPYISYNYVGGSSATAYTNAQVIRYTNSPNITRIFFKDTTNNNIAFNAGDYIVINFYLEKSQYFNEESGKNPYSYISTIGSNPSCDIISIDFNTQEFLDGNNTSFVLRYNGTITCHTNSGGTNPSINLLIRSNLYPISPAVESIRFSFSSMSIYSPVEQHDVNAEQEEAANNAISDSESSSENNSSNAQTTNLIGALSNIFTTISSTSATNCNITGDLGAINMGALNLCQGKEYFNSLIEFIGFSALFVVVFWASYHLVRRTLGLIDWARSN